MDDDAEAVEIIDGFTKQGWLTEFSTHDELAKFVGGEPILNKFACLTKHKWDPVSRSYVSKRRLIMDSKRSFVKEASNTEYRSILPRVTDACNDTMHLLDEAGPEEHVQMMVLDLSLIHI